MSNRKSIKGSDLAEQIADSKRISVVKLVGDDKIISHSIPRDSINITDDHISLPLKGEGATGSHDGTDTMCSFSTKHLSIAKQQGEDFYRLKSCGCEYAFFTNELAEVN